MECVFREQLGCELARCEHVAPVVVDVFWRNDAVLLDLLLAVLDAEELAGAFKLMLAIGQCEGERLRVEHVAAENVAPSWA